MQKPKTKTGLRGNNKRRENRTSGFPRGKSKGTASKRRISTRVDSDKVREILRHELIGLEAEIIEAKNKNLVGINGRIRDETRNMIEIEDKKLIKDQIKLMIKKKGKKYEVDGRQLVGRPEDRIKKIRKI